MVCGRSEACLCFQAHPASPRFFSQLGSGYSLPQKGTLQDLEDRTKGKQSCFVGLCEPAGRHQYDRHVILLMSWSLILWQVLTTVLRSSLVIHGTDQQPRPPSFRWRYTFSFTPRKKAIWGIYCDMMNSQN